MRLLLLLAIPMLVSGPGCGIAVEADRTTLMALWRSGDRPGALTEARAVIGRYAEANDTTLAALVPDARAARQRLSEEPIPPADAKATGPLDPLTSSKDHIDTELREALAHPEALVAIRAAVTVGDLSLLWHAPGLLELISRPGPIGLTRKIPELRDPVQAWLVTKVVALHALERMAP